MIADGLAPNQRLVFNAAIFAVLGFFTVSLPTAWREQRRRERTDREWSAYTDQFKDAGYATRRDWPLRRSRN